MNSTRLGSGPVPWRLLTVASIFLSIAIASAVMTYVSVGIQSTVRAIVAASVHWSASQREAAHFLTRYSIFGDAEDLARYDQALEVPLAARSARAGLRNRSMDDASIRRLLIEAGLHPADVAGVITLFRCCSRMTIFADLADAWDLGAPSLVELQRLGEQVRAQRVRNPADEVVDDWARRLRALDTASLAVDRTTRLAMDAGSVWIRTELRVINGAAVLLLIGLGLWLTLRIVFGQRRSETRFQGLLDNAGDALLVVDPDSGRIQVANRTAEAMLGIPAATLIGQPYPPLFVGQAPPLVGESGMRTAVLRGPLDTHRDVEVNCGTTQWGGRRATLAIIRDISERLVAEQERRIATNAMANMSEAVVITDERMRVVSVNPAFTTITGYASADVQGRMPCWFRFGTGPVRRRAPIESLRREGRWQGELTGARIDGRRIPHQVSVAAVRERSGRITHYVVLFTDNSAMREHELRLRHLANHDVLTALPNRAALEDRAARTLPQAREEGRSLALMFVDLDGFKGINDTYGHAAGDEVLRVIGNRIRSVLRVGDFVARVGGDEFNLLLDNVSSDADVARIAQMLLDLAIEPIDCQGHQVSLSSSIGVCFFPRDADDFETMATHADMAMYEAKSRGRNNYRIYTSEISLAARQRQAMAVALREAIEREQLALHYQPVVAMDSGMVVGVQALLRWDHPEFGLVPPARFVPLAEEIGLIDDFSQWIMQRACLQGVRWRAQGLGELVIGIKLSPRNFRDPELPARIAAAIAESGWPASRLSLEVTEAAISNRSAGTERSLQRLAALGVSIAIDGFGVGQSSLAHLRGLPLSTLKVDRSFTCGLPHDRESLAMIRGIIALARGLGVSVVAEGIETRAQHDILLAEGCTQGVGYFYGRPMPAAAVERLLTEGPRLVAESMMVV